MFLANRYWSVLWIGLTALGAQATPEIDCSAMIAAGTLANPAVVTIARGSERIPVAATHAYIDPKRAIKPLAKNIAEVVLGRSPEEQLRINAALRATHGGYENSFFSKVGPGAGEYFVPEVHGTVIPIEAARFQRMIHSTEPLLRTLRRLLQGFYGDSRLDPGSLGLLGMPPEDVARVVAILTESIYYEPKLRHAAMKDYPFIAVTGFDAALTEDPVHNVFFEYNVGTPSGYTHSLQLFEALRVHDPVLYRTVMARHQEDDTFPRLRATIESNARKWTGRADGISVVVSPGLWNAAHPDVAYVAAFSGMPLVKLTSMYIDSTGAVRLNVGHGAENPRVTGVYNRMEDSYFFADAARGLGARSPSAATINTRLSHTLGLPLRGSLMYAYRYDNQSQAVDVERDGEGRPQLQGIWDRLGTDPTRPGVAAGSLLEAMHGRHLYVSNAGTRVADDKALFAILARWLGRNDPALAAPPRTLAAGQYQEFYDSKDLSQWAVKRPNRSGADGVDILVGSDDAARAAVMSAVRQDESGYVVQKFVSTTAFPVAEPVANGRPAHFGTRFGDLRLFILMDGEGNVSGTSHGMLARVARDGSPLSNTGARGGYGMVTIVETDAKPVTNESLIPVPASPFLPVLRIPDVRSFLARLDELTTLVSPDVELARDGEALEAVSLQLREIMDLVGREAVPVGDALKKYASGALGLEALRTAINSAKQVLLSGASYGNTPLAFHVNEGVGTAFPTGAMTVAEQRQGLLQYFKSNGYPVMMKTTPVGNIPTLLVNGVNANYVPRLFARTLGFQVEHQPSAQYDHGYVRVGRFVIDRDTPGRRRAGELHTTGITWLDAESNLAWRTQRAAEGHAPNVRIEVLFLPTDTEMKTARYYQALRRAGFFDTRYWYGGDTSQAVERLDGVTEHCFTFSKGSAARAQANELASRLAAMGIRDVARWRTDAPRAALLGALRARAVGWIATAESNHDLQWFRPTGLDDVLVNGNRGDEVVAQLAGISSDVTLTRRALRLLASWDAAESYASLIEALHISASGDFNADLTQAERVAALVVYDFHSDAFGKFSNATWSSQGRTGAWRATGQSAVQY